MGIVWTAAQQAAIEAREGDYVVTASAGSGKTAVLAARVVALLSGEGAATLPEILALTFTDKAAGEMRQRIGKALREVMAARPGDGALRRQAALLDQAEIGTIHSFCTKLLREYGQAVGRTMGGMGIEADFEVMDENAAQTLARQVMREVFEQAYADEADLMQGATLEGLVRNYGSGGSDQLQMQLILRLHQFLASAVQWTEDKAAGQTQLVQRHKAALLGRLDRILGSCELGVTVCQEVSGAEAFEDYLRGDVVAPLRELRDLVEQERYDTALEQMDGWKWNRAPSIKDESVKDALVPAVALRDRSKELFKKATSELGVLPEQLAAQEEAVRQWEGLILGLHGAFDARYTREKRRRGVVDFNDLERLAYKLLYGENVEVVEQLRRQYRFILVDEYQDVSPIQDAIIQALRGKRRDGGLMMIGDVKQSIYGFRQAEPEVFLGRCRAFESGEQLGGQLGGRIDLQRNFRSGRAIVEAVNAVFGRCMSRTFGGMDYDERARLEYGAVEQAEGGEDEPVELHLLDLKEREEDKEGQDEGEPPGDEPTPDVVTAEARWVGGQIMQMVREQGVRYGEIVVLLRSLKNQGSLWAQMLQQQGVPVHAELRSGLLEATEVQDVLNLLAVLDNPRQDIPLAGFLRGPLAGFTDAQLLEIRRRREEMPFFAAVQWIMEHGEAGPLRERLTQTGQWLEQWRQISATVSVGELLRRLYRQTQYPQRVLSEPLGRQRQGNLYYLVELAQRYEQVLRGRLGQASGLSGFLGFLEAFQEQEGDFAPPPTVGAGDDAVRLMSIHQSKGLEFPVVIVAGLSKGFNLRDCREAVQWHRAFPGRLGMIQVDEANGRQYRTVRRELMAQQRRRELLEEELRLLYVAMTRAQRRLIMTGVVDCGKAAARWRPWRYCAGVLPDFALEGAGSALDWLGMALAQGKVLEPLFDEDVAGEQAGAGDGPWRLQIRRGAQARAAEVAAGRKPLNRGEMLAAMEAIDFSGKQIEPVLKPLRWQYPYMALAQAPARMSVTDVKHHLTQLSDEQIEVDGSGPIMAEGGADVFARVATFMERGQGAGDMQAVGSWTHAFLERVDLAGRLDEAGLREQMDGMVVRGLFSEEQAQAILLTQIAGFFAGELGRRVVEGECTVLREWPFTLKVPLRQLQEDVALPEDIAEEFVVVRGIIDCLLCDEQGCVIIDYKTDRVAGEQIHERATHYAVPMRFYRQAVETILGKPVRESWLYFLVPGRAVSVGHGS